MDATALCFPSTAACLSGRRCAPCSQWASAEATEWPHICGSLHINAPRGPAAQLGPVQTQAEARIARTTAPHHHRHLSIHYAAIHPGFSPHISPFTSKFTSTRCPASLLLLQPPPHTHSFTQPISREPGSQRCWPHTHTHPGHIKTASRATPLFEVID